MPKRTRLTDQQIAKLPRKVSRYTLPDPELIGHYLRIPPRTSRAPVAFAVIARGPNGKQVWETIGTADTTGIEPARDLARATLHRIKAGKSSNGPLGATVADTAAQWLERHVRKSGHRTAEESERIVAKYIVPRIGNRPIADVRRSDVAQMLDQIEDESGRSMADSVLKTYRAISRWLQLRDESYAPPLTTGMNRVPKTEGRRKRILNDDEIRKVWHVGATNFAGTTYAAFVKLALLTGQRRDKLHKLQWSDIHDDIWVIPTEPREKGNPGQIKLPRLTLDIIKSRPRFVGNPYVFAGSRNGHAAATLFSGTYKTEFDKLCGVSGWRLHDLRRTARSLMSRAGVQTEIAERVIGHARGELIEIYDRYDYQSEMADALKRLATLIEQIVDPQPNVVALQSRSGT
jgi:integrase